MGYSSALSMRTAVNVQNNLGSMASNLDSSVSKLATLGYKTVKSASKDSLVNKKPNKRGSLLDI